MPLATFVASLASGVSEFSKLATMKGDITTVDADGKQITRPFNLQDVGTGISAVISNLLSDKDIKKRLLIQILTTLLVIIITS